MDSGVNRYCASPKKGVHNRRNKRNRIKVKVADGKNIDQVQKSKAPFDQLPIEAADVQIFPHMPNAF